MAGTRRKEMDVRHMRAPVDVGLEGLNEPLREKTDQEGGRRTGVRYLGASHQGSPVQGKERAVPQATAHDGGGGMKPASCEPIEVHLAGCIHEFQTVTTPWGELHHFDVGKRDAPFVQAFENSACRRIIWINYVPRLVEFPEVLDHETMHAVFDRDL